MRTLRCKCGDKTMSTSMGSQDCQGCEKCKTTFAGHPDHHNELKPHEWIERFHQNTGKPYKICKICHKIDRDSYDNAAVK